MRRQKMHHAKNAPAKKKCNVTLRNAQQKCRRLQNRCNEKAAEEFEDC